MSVSSTISYYYEGFQFHLSSYERLFKVISSSVVGITFLICVFLGTVARSESERAPVKRRCVPDISF